MSLRDEQVTYFSLAESPGANKTLLLSRCSAQERTGDLVCLQFADFCITGGSCGQHLSPVPNAACGGLHCECVQN